MTTTETKWRRVSRHRTKMSAREMRARLVRAGRRPKEVRINAISEGAFKFCVQVDWDA